ncbi:hypothetical protein VTK73DRAFT_7432 [Phialemonium thermophilum]|uniref:Receptor-activated Ca2+-permeable cation channel n=1 Tax=Phialemonium thermophilum TaxID=223376 RepID=A0ABR3WEP6_9PEZI
MSGPSHGRKSHIRVQDPERRPLLRQSEDGETEGEPDVAVASSASSDVDGPVFSCNPSSHSHLPVYTNIHRIRHDIISVVEDYLSLDQLRDMHINISVVRPLVDKFYDPDDISVVYCLLVNRAQFLNEQSHLKNRQNANFTRATLCELIATRVLRRLGEEEGNSGGAGQQPGGSPQGLLVLAQALLAGFEPFQNAPEEVRREAHVSASWHSTMPALEVAILSESKLFLSSTSCQKVVDAVYEGRIIYTPSSFLNLIPDRYKKKPISLYDPREAPLLNQYRLIVPRTRNILEIVQFGILLALYLAFMAERNTSRISSLEVCFTVYAFGWVLDLLATVLEHGWHVYTQNLWSFLDVTFAAVYLVYLALRIYGRSVHSLELAQQALDVLALGAPVLVPRLAFNLLSDNLLFVSLRSMMADFTLLTALAAWCFFGFLLSLVWLGEGRHEAVTISKWMIYIWFGLDGTGIQRSTEFHRLLGPALMVAFSFLGNTLFLTILVSMLSNTFSTIVSNATAEIQFRHAVLTLEGVKSDAIFAYQPPFNILAMMLLVPLKFLASPRWFHKIHVASVRSLNLPLLLVIALVERRILDSPRPDPTRSGSKTPSGRSKGRPWFWEKWRITAHGSIEAVFDVPVPDSVVDEITADEDELRTHSIRRQFTAPPRPRHQSPAVVALAEAQRAQSRGGRQSQRQPSSGLATERDDDEENDARKAQRRPQLEREESYVSSSWKKTSSRRDSVAPFPGLLQQLRGLLPEAVAGEDGNGRDIDARLGALEESTARIEELLRKLTGDVEEIVEEAAVEDTKGEDEALGKTGMITDLDQSIREP